MMIKHTVSTYTSLLKPGIIRSNTFAAVAGYLFASGLHVRGLELLGLFSGMALIIASACVFNNYFDREMDAKMERTKNRPLASGQVSGRSALEFASILLLLGMGSLATFTNLLTLGIAMIGFISYVFIYTPIKKRSVHGTLVGSIPGATPPAAGYVAYTGNFDTGALLLALVLIFWQMPHFFAIALYRLNDYKKARMPVLPVVEGTRIAKLWILAYIVGFIWACALIKLLGYSGWSFAIVTCGLGLAWLLLGLKNYHKLDDIAWGKKMFLFSLIIITSLSVMMALANILP